MKEKRKTRIGLVVSDKMERTVVVLVKTSVRHPRYHKIVRRAKKYKAHDDNSCRVGDQVRLEETRPLSKDKRWRVTEILARKNLIETKNPDSQAE